MEITKIRRENIRNFISANFKTRLEFANAIGKSPSQVAMWFMESNGKRDIGEKLAREIESSLQLPNKWLDKLHTQHIEEFRNALKEAGYKVSLNKAIFSYNEDKYCPSLKVEKNSDIFIVDVLDSHLSNPKKIRMASGLNLHHMDSHPDKAIVLLFEDDLYFAKHGGFDEVILKRLELARNGSPFDESDFQITIGEQAKPIEQQSIWSRLQSVWQSAAGENKHNDAIIAAKEILSRNGFNVIVAPTGKNASRLVVLNKSIWSLPSLIVNIPEYEKSFYIDIYPEKRLLIIPVMPDNKFSEILYIKQNEVIDIVPITEAHIKKWFGPA